MFVLTVLAVMSASFAYMASLAANHAEWAVEGLAKRPFNPNLQLVLSSPPKMSDFEQRSRMSRSPLSRLSTSAVSIGEEEEEDYDEDEEVEVDFEGVEMTSLTLASVGNDNSGDMHVSGAKRQQQTRKSPTGRRGVNYASVGTGDYDE
jgi:hypothetical protein